MKFKLSIIKLLFVLPVFFLIGCSGTGIKEQSIVKDVTSGGIAELGGGQIIVYRARIFGGSGVLYPVQINGKPAGKIGIGEFLVGDLIEGENHIKAEMPGWGFLGDVTEEKFQNDQSDNRYFVITPDFGLTNKIVIQEVDKSDWDKAFQN